MPYTKEGEDDFYKAPNLEDSEISQLFKSKSFDTNLPYIPKKEGTMNIGLVVEGNTYSKITQNE